MIKHGKQAFGIPVVDGNRLLIFLSAAVVAIAASCVPLGGLLLAQLVLLVWIIVVSGLLVARLALTITDVYRRHVYRRVCSEAVDEAGSRLAGDEARERVSRRRHT
jgi:hypothetical protein